MRTQQMQKCFNGHTEPHLGCAGCHHAFHVLAPGAVVGGKLVPPRVIGPLECPLCHEALHVQPVVGCKFCDATFIETVAMAMEASKDARVEVIGLQFTRWFVGWHARILGWLAILSGSAFTGFFSRPDGSTEWIKLALSMIAVPVAQKLIDKQIARKQRHLPHLGPHAEIKYGDPDP